MSQQARMSFDAPPEPFDPRPVPVRDSHVTSPAAQRRLSGQTAEIIARLRQGSASARELNAIAINYRARVSDARAVGYVIDCQHDPETGASVYTLHEGEK